MDTHFWARRVWVDLRKPSCYLKVLVTHHCHTLKNEWVPCGVLLGSVWPEIGGLMRAGAKGRHPRS